MGKYAHEILNDLSSAQIAEYMAFDKLKDNKYLEKLESDMMSDEERMLKIKQLLGFKE